METSLVWKVLLEVQEPFEKVLCTELFLVNVSPWIEENSTDIIIRFTIAE